MTLEAAVADTLSNSIGEAPLSTTGSKLRIEIQRLLATGRERTYWGGEEVANILLDVLIALTADEAAGDVDIDDELRLIVETEKPEPVA